MRTDRYSQRLYDERVPPEPTYPSIRPSEADFRNGDEESLSGGKHRRCQLAADEDVTHAPPGLGIEMCFCVDYKTDHLGSVQTML